MKTNKIKKTKIESIQIGLASPDEIKKWAERILPNGKRIGQVISSQTLNYKTLRPETGGLFCERIFGPIVDFECICGNKKTNIDEKFCLECGVELTSSKIRRHRLGYIELTLPVTHIWFLKGRPNYISLLLGMPKKKLESITYCTEIMTNVYQDSKYLKIKNDRKNKIYYSLSKANTSWELSTIGKAEFSFFFDYMTKPCPLKKDFPIFRYAKKIAEEKIEREQLGGEAIQNLLSSLNLFYLEKELRNQLFCIKEDLKDLESEIKNLYNQGYILYTKEQYDLKKFFTRQFQLLILIRAKKIRRLKIIRQFRRTETRPEWMVLSILPVLPPDLRPIIQLEGDQIAVSDLNKLYQKILYRNKRLKKYSSKKFDNVIFQHAQRLLQESVDALIDNGKGGTEPICAANDRPLKSLSDMLKGKKGRFRQNLLGKRVDYSGRSVIVVDPTLKLHQCGLPKELAIELFQPFLIKKLLAKEEVRTIVGAKKILQKEDNFVFKILKQIMETHPVLLNRAPTLHRMGFQAFQPLLVEGQAILLHPLVCTAFNADFDGDQMGVHIPLSFQARAEAWSLIWSRNNLLSPATGHPTILPSQDMVVGCYYLTTKNLKIKKNITHYFNSINEALTFFYLKNKSVHSKIWIQWNNTFETFNEKEKILEIQIQSKGSFITIFYEFKRFFDIKMLKKNQYIRTTFGRAIFNQILNENLKIKKEGY